MEETTPYGGARSVAVGEGAVWALSGTGKLQKVDPRTNEVVAAVALGDYPSDLAVAGGYVWAAGQDRSGASWLKRVDPRTVEDVWSRGLGSPNSGAYGRIAADGEVGRVWFVEGGWREGKGTLTRLDP